MALVKWNPGRDLLDIEREFGRMFKDFESRFGFFPKKQDEENGYENAVWSPLTDISEDKENFYLNLDLPGIDKKDVKISYSEGELSISGERKQEKEEKDKRYHRVERSYGKYYRSFNLPQKIKEDEIEAEFKNGQLHIVIPKAEEAKPKEIAVNIK